VHGYGLPRDPVAWAALGAALVALALALWRSERISRGALAHPRRVVAVLAAAAFLLSLGYLVHYLRGGPRIIDATSYFLEARALARGFFAFPLLAPTGSFRGRFTLVPPGSHTLAVLFPPGYPALLALGFWLRAPLAVGPVIGAALVAATFALAKTLTQRDDVALVAATLSVLSAALRYHTADTMSHGFAALLLVLALLAALRGGRWAWLAGVALGWLLATRPVTGLTGAVLVVLVELRRDRRALVPIALAAVPGVLLLLAHQHASTGTWLGSSQLRYYALADGPPGCFRYGFGAGIGCLHEHGDFVRERLPNGYGLLAALGTSWRRLWSHAGDIANLGAFAWFLPWAAWVGRREPAVRLLALVPLALLFAYAPFYFDGNYPGGGARLLAEALPFEHVLLAWGLIRLGVARFAPGAVLLGFALHASRDHEALSAREGGRPMFEPAVANAAGVTHGLLFTATDHGFSLAHVPGAREARAELVVARYRGDAHDWLLWNRLGRPPAFRYLYDPSAPLASPSVERFQVPPSSRFEAEAEWPPLDVQRGWVEPAYPGAACARGSPGLRLHGPVRVTLELGVLTAGRYVLVPRWVALAATQVQVSVTTKDSHWASSCDVAAAGCQEMPGPPLDLAGDFPVELETQGDALVLDSIEVRPAVPEGGPKKR
jgi:hypothetical protein